MRWVVAAAVGALVLALSGCGGGTGSPETSATSGEMSWELQNVRDACDELSDPEATEHSGFYPDPFPNQQVYQGLSENLAFLDTQARYGSVDEVLRYFQSQRNHVDALAFGSAEMFSAKAVDVLDAAWSACIETGFVEGEGELPPILKTRVRRNAAIYYSAMEMEDAPPSNSTRREVDADLAAAGFAAGDLRELRSRIYLHRYALDAGKKVTWDDLQTTASLFLLNCEKVASGVFTWEDQIDTDLSVGTSIEDAEGIWYYIRDEFCPIAGL